MPATGTVARPRRMIAVFVTALVTWAAASCAGDGVDTGGEPDATSGIDASTTTTPSSTTAATPAPPLTTTATPTTVPATTTTVATTVPPPTTLALDRRPRAVTTRLEAYLDHIAGIGPRTGGSQEEAELAAWLVEEITARTGVSPEVEDVPLPDGSTSINVWVPPVGEGVTVLLGAHIDTVPESPGIDDNGSGTVVLLELLRRLVEEPVEGVAVQIVFFGAEEVIEGGTANDHHYGSRQAAQRLAESGELPEWMISVDMVGVGSQLVAAAYEGTDPAAASLLVAAGSNVGETVISLDRGDISDHEAFARAGSRAVMMWRPDNPAWHTPEDDEVITARLLADLAVLEAFLALVAG